jgi:hypothetical protein
MAKSSTSHKYRQVTYLKPSENKIIEAYSKITGESKSSIIHVAVKKFINDMPVEQKVVIIKTANNS